MNMKFWNAGSGKPEDIVHAVKNAEAVTIPAGSPVVYAMNGTDDGLAVILPSSSTAAKIASFTAGVAVKAIEPGKLADIQVYGFNRRVNVVRGTRANSTASWATAASIVLGNALTIDSALNGFVDGAAVAAANIQPIAVLAEAIAASTGGASSANGANPASATVYYQAAKAFLRFL